MGPVNMEKRMAGMDITEDKRISRLEDQKRGLIDYLKLKTISEDWHAVQDAASDIRKIEAKLSVLK